MGHPKTARAGDTPDAHKDLVTRLIPPEEMEPGSIDEVTKLPSFLEKIRACEEHCRSRYAEIDHSIQNALALRRLQQMVNTLMLNPLWNERIREAGLKGAPRDFDEWQLLPISDKEDMRHLFMGSRPGMVVPLSRGNFEIVATGGTSSGKPVQAVYPLSELHDTYELAGEFMGDYILADHLAGDEPKWVITSLADFQMWSSGAMVGGVLQKIPGVNYIGAGPVGKKQFQRILSYEGKKAFMAISQGIAILTDFASGLSREARESFRVALYGSGLIPHRKLVELKELYPNLKIMSYFAATQAETIGLQSTPDSYLTTVPGLHLVEIVDDQGRWVDEGAEGELVVTRLHGHEAPFPRFRLGDRAIRRPNLDGAGLKTQQFEFAGRSGDVIHLAHVHYTASRTYAALCQELRAADVLDLEALAHEAQFLNDRKVGTLTLIAAVDAAEESRKRLESKLGQRGVERLFMQAMIGSLSLYNQSEANFESIEEIGYDFQIRFVTPGSPEIFRTEFGKVPLIKDTI